jgi:hypothetical protein
MQHDMARPDLLNSKRLWYCPTEINNTERENKLARKLQYM